MQVEIEKTKKMADVLSDNMAVYEAKTKLSVGKLTVLGMMAGLFIAIGASSSSVATFGIGNVGLAKTLAGIIFPVGLMLVVIVGAELFTGDCLMLAGVLHKRIRPLRMVRVLSIVFIMNLLGSLIVVVLVNRSGQLDYGNAALAVSAIRTAYTKMNLSFVKAFTSGIMCNILVCFAVLLAATAQSTIGKMFAVFFPIWAFVVAGYEHCVANMYYIPAGILAKCGDTYYQAAINAGMTAQQLDSMTVGSFLLNNLLPVTLGNIVGGMLFVALPLYLVHKKNIK